MQIIKHKLEKALLIFKLVSRLELKLMSGLKSLLRTIPFLLLIGISTKSYAQSIGLQVDTAHNVIFGDSLQGAGAKMMWIPSKAAFRAGDVFDVNLSLIHI